MTPPAEKTAATAAVGVATAAKEKLLAEEAADAATRKTKEREEHLAREAASAAEAARRTAEERWELRRSGGKQGHRLGFGRGS